MGIASMMSGKIFLSPLLDTGSHQPVEIEQVATIAWQWLVSAAVIAWAGTLITEWRLLAATRGEQRTGIASLLLVSIQRRRRQSWLWLSMILSGTIILFWLRIAQAVPHMQLDELPNWPTLARFLLSTSEGWLWLIRGGLITLAIGSSGVSVFFARRHARTNQAHERLVGHEHSFSCGCSRRYTRERSSRRQQLPAEHRRTDGLHLVLAAFFLLTLANSSVTGASFYFTALALNWVTLLALAAWLGGVLYLAFVFVPATHVIESGERAQTLIELLPTIKPSIIQVLTACGLSAIFSMETHTSRMNTSLAAISLAYSWAIIANVGLLGMVFLLTCYQERHVLPHLAQTVWLATRGAFIGVMGGVDVLRSLQVSQNERQAPADLATQRFRCLLYAQVVLGMLILLCLVLTAAPPPLVS